MGGEQGTKGRIGDVYRPVAFIFEYSPLYGRNGYVWLPGPVNVGPFILCPKTDSHDGARVLCDSLCGPLNIRS